MLLAFALVAAAMQPSASPPPEIGHVTSNRECDTFIRLGPMVSLAGADDDIVDFSRGRIARTDYSSNSPIRLNILHVDHLATQLHDNIERLTADLNTLGGAHAFAGSPKDLPATTAVRDEVRSILNRQKEELNQLTGFTATTQMLDAMRDVVGAPIPGVGRFPHHSSGLPQGTLDEMKSLVANTLTKLSLLQDAEATDESSLIANLTVLASHCHKIGLTKVNRQR